ncbi:MAG: glycerophosphodiester phosphodiesterase family protein [Fusobacteriaceae bacterium]
MEKIIFAHRGMSSLAPENTISAFKLCKENGLKWFECDVDFLKDETIVITHDDTLDRCTNKSGKVYELEKKDLENIDAGSWYSEKYIGERIPTFEELIKVINNFELNVNLEIKPSNLSENIIENNLKNLTREIKKINSNIKIIVSSFDHVALSKFKKMNPHISVACLYWLSEFSKNCVTTLEHCQAEYIHPENSTVTKELVEYFKNKNYKINIYTVNDLSRANELFNWGVDGIFTDVPQYFPSKYKIY